VQLSFARDQTGLEALAQELGAQVSTGTPDSASRFGEVVVISVPWSAIPIALEQMGPLDGQIVVDTTNQFGSGPMPASGQTAAAFNAARMPGARYTKSFNTLTSAFQAEAAERDGDDRVVQWVCGDDADARGIVCGLIESMGYVPVDLGGTSECEVMEAPRRPGAVYGEEYRLPDARAVVRSVRAGQPIPPTPSYR
jgi:predicted dinucleotide-binding enzyme